MGDELKTPTEVCVNLFGSEILDGGRNRGVRGLLEFIFCFRVLCAVHVLVWSVNRKPYGLPGASVHSLGQRRSRTGLTTMFFVPAPVGRYVFLVFSLPSLVRHACLLSRCIRHRRPLAACRARYSSPFATVPATRWRRPELFAFPSLVKPFLAN